MQRFSLANGLTLLFRVEVANGRTGQDKRHVTFLSEIAKIVTAAKIVLPEGHR